MRYTDITTPCQGTSTHPFVATIIIDPSMWSRFDALWEDRPEMKVLRVDRSRSQAWTIYAACASRSVRDLLESW
jgi:hypothetical protein